MDRLFGRIAKPQGWSVNPGRVDTVLGIVFAEYLAFRANDYSQ
jgi:hypothetical protein